MYIIIELQVANDGTVGNIVQTASTYNEAMSKYHQILAAAAISSVPKHSCVVLTCSGEMVTHECYVHGAAVTE